MKRLSAVLALVAAALAARASFAQPVLPFDEVAPGMRGTGRTVFSGTEVETFDVEILGKLRNIGPGQNLILGRLSGGPLEHTGVLAGMSGSPVSIDGRLVGAVAYTWGFSKDPIAGITPIEEMLRVAEIEDAGAARSARAFDPSLELGRLRAPERLQAFFDELLDSLAGFRGARATPLPLAVAGFGPAGVERLQPMLGSLGFVPLQVGGSGPAEPEAAPPLEPGSAMGLRLVGGDVEMTATGTVTWVDASRVIGFGHPLFGLGAVEMPLTGARVEALLPSLLQSSRIAAPLAEVGALRQDRSAGVVGRLGARPRVIPVRLELTGGSAGDDRFSFEIADDPLLSPLLLYVSLTGIVSSRERAFGSATVRLRKGSVIKMIGSEDVELDNLFAGPAAFDLGTGLAAYILYLLLNNTWSQPQIAGVNLLLDYDAMPRTARIRRVTADRYRVAPGEGVEITVVLSPWRGQQRVITRELVIPPETPAGTLNLAVGGAMAISRATAGDEPVLPRDLDQLIRLINQLRRNDRLYLVATHDDDGVLLDGTRLPNLPPSAVSLLSRPRRQGDVAPLSQRAVLEEVVATDYAVEGSARIQLAMETR